MQKEADAVKTAELGSEFFNRDNDTSQANENKEKDGKAPSDAENNLSENVELAQADNSNPQEPSS